MQGLSFAFSLHRGIDVVATPLLAVAIALTAASMTVT
jgi:hypothetical protein